MSITIQEKKMAEAIIAETLRTDGQIDAQTIEEIGAFTEGEALELAEMLRDGIITDAELKKLRKYTVIYQSANSERLLKMARFIHDKPQELKCLGEVISDFDPYRRNPCPGRFPAHGGQSQECAPSAERISAGAALHRLIELQRSGHDISPSIEHMLRDGAISTDELIFLHHPDVDLSKCSEELKHDIGALLLKWVLPIPRTAGSPQTVREILKKLGGVGKIYQSEIDRKVEEQQSQESGVYQLETWSQKSWEDVVAHAGGYYGKVRRFLP